MRESSTVEVYMHLADLKRQFSKSEIRKNFILRNMGGEDFFFRHKAVQRGKTVQNRTGTWYEDDERRKLGINIEWKRCQRRRLIKNIWPECERLVERWPAAGQLLPSGPTSGTTSGTGARSLSSFYTSVSDPDSGVFWNRIRIQCIDVLY